MIRTLCYFSLLYVLLSVAFFRCTKKNVNQKSTNSLIGSWNWIKTVDQSDSTIDSTSTSNMQQIKFSDIKNYEWTKNGGILHNGFYVMDMRVSQVYQQSLMTLNLYNFPNMLLVRQIKDTLFLEEDIANRNVFQFVKVH